MMPSEPKLTPAQVEVLELIRDGAMAAFSHASNGSRASVLADIRIDKDQLIPLAKAGFLDVQTIVKHLYITEAGRAALARANGELHD